MVVGSGSAFGTADVQSSLSNFCLGQEVAAEVCAPGLLLGMLGLDRCVMTLVATDTQGG